MNRLLFLSFAVFALSACSSSQPDRGPLARVDPVTTGQIVSSRETLSAAVTVADETSANAILTLPPDAGAPLRMSERQYANGWRQSVSLDAQKVAGDWNDMSIDIMTDEPGEAKRANIPMGKPTQDAVRREILARFPGTPMRIVGRPMQNGLGSFGLAIGAGTGGLRCAFAWQWVDDLRNVKGSKSFFNKGMAASIRMRLCRAGVTADQLASWFEQLDISNAANVDRVAEAAAKGTNGQVIDHTAEPSSGAAVAGGEVVDPSSSLESALGGGGGAKTVTVGRRAAPRHVAKRQRAPSAEPREEPEQEAPVAAAPAPQTSGGRQYLGPVTADSAPAYAQPAPVSRGAGFGQTRLNPGLPAQAFQGPAARGGATAVGYGGQPQYLGR